MPPDSEEHVLVEQPRPLVAIKCGLRALRNVGIYQDFRTDVGLPYQVVTVAPPEFSPLLAEA